MEDSRNRWIPLDPVVSDQIIHKRLVSDLNIVKLSDCTAPADGGGKDIMIFCDEISKEDIEVRIFETSNQWESIVAFPPGEVYKKTGISFKIPPYHDQKIEEPAQVLIQLRRPSDFKTGEPRAFEYLPLDECTRFFNRKKKHKNYTNLQLDENIAKIFSELQGKSDNGTNTTHRTMQDFGYSTQYQRIPENKTQNVTMPYTMINISANEMFNGYTNNATVTSPLSATSSPQEVILENPLQNNITSFNNLSATRDDVFLCYQNTNTHLASGASPSPQRLHPESSLQNILVPNEIFGGYSPVLAPGAPASQSAGLPSNNLNLNFNLSNDFQDYLNIQQQSSVCEVSPNLNYFGEGFQNYVHNAEFAETNGSSPQILEDAPGVLLSDPPELLPAFNALLGSSEAMVLSSGELNDLPF